MNNLRGAVFCLLILAYIAICQADDYDYGDNYDYGDEDTYTVDECDDIGNCNFHNSDCGGDCNHSEFRALEIQNLTIKKMFGDRVKKCCSNHGYTFFDYCEVNIFLGSERASALLVASKDGICFVVVL